MLLENTGLLLYMAMVFGFVMAWGVGANDVANAMGTSVGAKALTLKQATLIAIVFELCGAFFAGSHVSDTIRSQLLDVSAFAQSPADLVLGMLASLLSSGTWLVMATYRGWPVSTTHSIVGAVVGFAAASVGWHSVHWQVVGRVVMSWVGTPLLASVMAYLLFANIQRHIFRAFSPVSRVRRHALIYTWMVVFILAYVLSQGVSRYVALSEGMMAVGSLVMALFGAMFAHVFYYRKISGEGLRRRQQFELVEHIFAILMVFTAAAMAFAHGSNDVANAVGPLASVVQIIDAGGDVYANGPIPSWVMLLGASGIVIGLATWGYRVIATIGSNITQLTPSRGFAAQLATSASVLLASAFGMPVSTTHTMVGAVLGVGVARGMGALNLRVVRNIFMSWAVTLPAGVFLSLGYFYLLRTFISAS